MAHPEPTYISSQVRLALEEDIGAGDLTANLLHEATKASAQIISRENAVICGIAWVNEVFRQLDDSIVIDWQCEDGQTVAAGQLLCRMSGPARALLSGERVALNFLQTLSAVASRTRRYVDAVAETKVHILDTRKTIPGLRLAQKYAVTCGGGYNHRIGLYDAILIKENHIAAAGSIAAALQQASELASGVEIEIEVESLDELQQALQAGAKRILLDNFNLEQLRQAVSLNAGQARLEASGGVTLQTIAGIAATGVDDISVGELTKDIKALDLSMRLEMQAG
ncbi:MAG: carboxylating nicotinate-nucleotide diphosphorylase [Chromatiales bacterium]|jgi:nicotinate-nucleotide pyrophosphorylase (carboxylating)